MSRLPVTPLPRSAADPTRLRHRWTFTASARVAWGLLLRARHWAPGTSALLPPYIGQSDREGSGLFDPVLATATPYTFYRVDGRLQVDLADVEARLASGRHPLMLLVHYFGLPHTDVRALRRLCDRYGTTLVEDCAHVLGPWPVGIDLGSVGHAAFYSLHKQFAVPSGGLLRVNDPGLPFDLLRDDERCPAEVVEQVARTDVVAVAQARRANYTALCAGLADVEDLEVLYPELGSSVPHDFPVRVPARLRESLYFALNDAGVPAVALYYRLVDPLLDPVARSQHTGAHDLSARILNLPVHQDLGREDVERVVAVTRAVLAQVRRGGAVPGPGAA